MDCKNCNKKIPAHAKFCEYCGTPVDHIPTQSASEEIRPASLQENSEYEIPPIQIAIAVGVITLLGLGYYFGPGILETLQEEVTSNSSAPMTSNSATSSIPDDPSASPLTYNDGYQAELTNISLTASSTATNTYHIAAEVENDSPHSISYIEMLIEAYDCPGNTVDSTCTHIGESYPDISIDGDSDGVVPSDQTRLMWADLTFNGLPPLKGNFLWTYAVHATYTFN